MSQSQGFMDSSWQAQAPTTASHPQGFMNTDEYPESVMAGPYMDQDTWLRWEAASTQVADYY